MENSSFLSNQNTSADLQVSATSPAQANPSFSSASEAQIFIHPDHEKGNLMFSNPTKNSAYKKTNNFTLILFSFLIGLLIISASATFFVFIPKSQNVSFAIFVKETVTSSSEKTEKVNEALEVLYKAVTNQSEDITLSSNHGLNPTFANAEKLQGLSEAASNLAKQGIDVFNNKENVKGFTVPKEDPNQNARKHRELAQNISDKAKDASISNKELIELINKNKNSPRGSEKLKKQASDLAETTTKYINEASYTANYYIALNEASIKLSTLAASIYSNYSKTDIDNTIGDLTSLKNKFVGYEKDHLPEEMNDYNKDVIATFDLIINLFQSVKKGNLDTEEKIYLAYENFLNDLSAVGYRSVHDELNFWQNNKIINSFEKLAQKQTEVQKQAEILKDKNNFFLLDWVGVS